MTTPTSALIGPARAFTLADGDLKAVSDRLDVMHLEGWLPKAADPDRPTPHRDPTSHPDDVKGPRWDCGLADHGARQCWESMVAHLRNAEQSATDVLCAAVAVDSRCVPVYRPTALTDAQLGVRRLRERLTALQRLHVQWSGDDVPRAQWLARQLMGPRHGRPEGCFEELRQARFDAQRIVREVGTGKPPPPCTKCRRVGSVGQPRKGGLCHACYQQRYRLKRRERQTIVRRAQEGAA